MSTVFIKNTQNNSMCVVAGRSNPLDNKHMAKDRNQIKINFDAKFKARFDDALVQYRSKPGQLATQIMTWWLEQPKYVRNLAITGFEAIPPEAHDEAAKAIAEYLVKQAAVPIQPVAASKSAADRPEEVAALESEGVKELLQGQDRVKPPAVKPQPSHPRRIARSGGQ